jgi:hypothetical protein
VFAYVLSIASPSRRTFTPQAHGVACSDTCAGGGT